MASFEFDNVKAEKEDALWRYNMENKLRIGLRFIGFLFVLVLLSCSSFPSSILSAVEGAGGFGRRYVSAFNKPLFTFTVVNIIIVTVYVLSSTKKTQNQKQSTRSRTDIYDEYVSSRRRIPTMPAISNSPITEVSTVNKQIVLMDDKVSTVNKQIVLLDDKVAVSPVKQQRSVVNSNTVRESKISPSTVEQYNKTIPTVAKKKPEVSSTDVELEQKQYRRTRSMVSESRHQRPQEFRRSETVVGSRELPVSGIEPPRKSMNEMSCEEFRLIIDSFIAEKKKTLMQENTAHYARRKESIVAKN